MDKTTLIVLMPGGALVLKQEETGPAPEVLDLALMSWGGGTEVWSIPIEDEDGPPESGQEG